MPLYVILTQHRNSLKYWDEGRVYDNLEDAKSDIEYWDRVRPHCKHEIKELKDPEEQK